MSKRLDLIYHSMGTMLDAGVDVRRAVVSQKRPGSFIYNRMVDDMHQQVCQGEALAAAMKRHPRQFPAVDIRLVEVGELSGNLSEIFKMLGRWHSMRWQMTRRIRSGMILPFIMIHAGAFIPSMFKAIFGKIAMGDYLREAWDFLQWFYIPAAVLFFIIWLTPRTGLPRLVVDTLALRVPWVAGALRYFALSQFCMTFKMMFSAGILMDQAVEGAADACGNGCIGQKLYGGGRKAREGKEVSEGFQRGLPFEFVESWLVGEETGDLDRVCERLADNFGDEARRRFEALAAWLPRLIYLIVMIRILMIVLQFYTGYFSNTLNMM